jgi:hypothetical protein
MSKIYYITAYDRNKGRRANITIPQSKEKTELILKDLKRQMRIAIPKYKNLSQFKIESIMKKKPTKKLKPAIKAKKVYTKTHTLAKVVRAHTRKIEARGGEIISKEKTKKGTVLKYKF